MTTSSRRQRRPPKRSPQQRRQGRPAAAAEVVDYSRDYADVRRDLRRIAVWSILLFGLMFAVYFIMFSV